METIQKIDYIAAVDKGNAAQRLCAVLPKYLHANDLTRTKNTKSAVLFFKNIKIQYHHYSQYNSVPAKGLEIVIFYIFH